MDAVGGIAAVIQLSELVIGVISSIIDCPNDIAFIKIEVSALKGMLGPLKDFLDNSKTFLGCKEKLDQAFEGCHKALKGLEALLPSPYKATNPGGALQRNRWQDLSIRLAWPTKQSKAKTLLDELRAHKQTISLALDSEAFTTLQVVNKKVGEVQREVNTVRKKVDVVQSFLTYSEMRELLDWLVTVDPSHLHQQSLKLHEEHTGRWVLICPAWTSWISAAAGSQTSRLLWIWGIPGAGKTILASFVINRLQSLSCSPGVGHTLPKATAYYYCYHARSHSDDVESFLGWVLAQLCRQGAQIPSELRHAWKTRERPGLSALLKAFNNTCQSFEKVFVVVDALDESQSRPEFLKTIRSIVGNPEFGNVHLLVTSRNEIDIRKTMEDISPRSAHISTSNSFVKKDIRRYIRTKLHTDERLKRWPSGLHQEMEERLSEGAKGMFRWASCQLQILRRLNSKGAIMDAISSLPESLDETYERILTRIPPQSRQMAHRALELLCDKTIFRPEIAEDLLEAVFWGDPDTKYPHDKFWDVDGLHESCVCLVTIDEEPSQLRYGDHSVTGRQIKLAHYTVKEFLFSSRIRQSQSHARHFHTDQARSQRALVGAVTTSLIWASDDANPEERTRDDWFDYCWKILPGILWGYYHTTAGTELSELDHLVLRLLDPAEAYLSRSASINLEVYMSGEDLTGPSWPLAPISEWGTPDNEGPAALVAQLLVLNLETLVERYLASLPRADRRTVLVAKVSFDIFRDCSLLTIAVATGCHRGVQVLLKLGARLDPKDRTSFYLAASPSRKLSRSWPIWEPPIDLEDIADHNPRAVPATALQVAVSTGNWRLARHLLDAGADPTMVGDPALPNSSWVPTREVARDQSPLQMVTTRPVRKGKWEERQAFILTLQANGYLTEEAADRINENDE